MKNRIVQANSFHHFYLKYFLIIFLICLLVATFQVNILFAFRPEWKKVRENRDSEKSIVYLFMHECVCVCVCVCVCARARARVCVCYVMLCDVMRPYYCNVMYYNITTQHKKW